MSKVIGAVNVSVHLVNFVQGLAASAAGEALRVIQSSFEDNISFGLFGQRSEALWATARIFHRILEVRKNCMFLFAMKEVRTSLRIYKLSITQLFRSGFADCN
jgi:hypothetical protein